MSPFQLEQNKWLIDGLEHFFQNEPEFNGKVTCAGHYGNGTNRYDIETSLGTLVVTPYDNWIACHFKDVEKAKQHLSGDRLNKFSGKWNWHSHEFYSPYIGDKKTYSKQEKEILLNAINAMVGHFVNAVIDLNSAKVA
jgi:hypothetical protein